MFFSNQSESWPRGGGFGWSVSDRRAGRRGGREPSDCAVVSQGDRRSRWGLTGTQSEKREKGAGGRVSVLRWFLPLEDRARGADRLAMTLADLRKGGFEKCY